MEFMGIDAFGWILITVGIMSLVSPLWQATFGRPRKCDSYKSDSRSDSK